jgi:CRP-like cAMP-binding protein
VKAVATPDRAAYVRLLDLEPEIGARLREDDRAEARDRLLLRTTTVPPGAWSLADAGPDGHPFGLVVVDGLLLQEAVIAGRGAQQLLGRGDVVLPQGAASESLDVTLNLVAATSSRVALLDDRLQAPFALWPGLALGLLERAGRQLARAAAQTGIAHLPRVEDRLEATFWDLADRFGRVTPSGIHIPLKLTHETLARMVGGRRPTISLALTALAERDILTRRRDGTWLLVAAAPTLPTNRTAAPAPPIAVADATPDALVAPRPWQAAAREELLATARLAEQRHAAAAARTEADRHRYRATRDRSQELRERTARERAERAATRNGRKPAAISPDRAPAAPSAG